MSPYKCNIFELDIKLHYILCNISHNYVFDKFELLASYRLQAKKDYSTQEFEQYIERLRSATCTGIRGITEISCLLHHQFSAITRFLHVLITWSGFYTLVQT